MSWWRFGRQRERAEDMLERAAHLAARHWRAFCETSPLPGNIHLRDRIAFFAQDFQPDLSRHFPALSESEAEIRLFVIVRGIQLSGTHRRADIERGLGIVLPR